MIPDDRWWADFRAGCEDGGWFVESVGPSLHGYREVVVAAPDLNGTVRFSAQLSAYNQPGTGIDTARDLIREIAKRMPATEAEVAALLALAEALP